MTRGYLFFFHSFRVPVPARLAMAPARRSRILKSNPSGFSRRIGESRAAGALDQNDCLVVTGTMEFLRTFHILMFNWGLWIWVRWWLEPPTWNFEGLSSWEVHNSNWLERTPSFFRGVGKNHRWTWEPPTSSKVQFICRWDLQAQWKLMET